MRVVSTSADLEDVAHLGEVRGQAVEFFGDVELVGEQRHFLFETLLVEFGA